MPKKPHGRPTKMTPEVLEKLKEGFMMSLTDREACLYAGITPDILYYYCRNNPDYSKQKELLKSNVSILAKKNLAEEIRGGSERVSTWWLERKSKDEFSTKSSNEVQHLDENGEKANPPSIEVKFVE